MSVRASDVDSYARVSRAFPAWLRRNFRGDRLTREMAYHLVMSVNPVGVEFMPVAVLAGSIDATTAETEESLRRLESRGFLRYDHETEFIWIIEQAAWQVNVGNTKNQDAMVRRLIRPAFAVPNFWPEFMAKYVTNLRLNLLGFTSDNLTENSSENSSDKGSVNLGVTQDAGYRIQDAASATPREEHPQPQPQPPQAYRTEGRDPWPEQASAPALDAYLAELRKTAMEPQGDVIEPFERAAVYLRDRMGRDPSTIPATLTAIVALAAKTHEFRRHPKYGDLFLRPNAVMGRRVGSPDGLGCDVKLPEWINKLAADKPKPAAPRPPPQPEPTPEETEATMTAAQLRKRADDAVTSSLRLPKGDKFETMLLARAERCRKRADELDAAEAINATTAS